ncbi:putative efflux pump antibiotic resistance protein [Hortaea werneckii]|nr:putative efflux pump antibiotic resistance protein [Hortaea werneckii]KAI6852812.1 putative efflux pump antibiotic resistance protein [Hortaea werneckii]KAI7215773.1 putative efflux pump antibiotic resistance protein [Hortaea werneckii]KAI7288899.1 putative efflux pump antibiotic resistance protein [Hortaea werneckii]KAI7311025.1 putative efflux pump antibiotic resistance protein [Hortaea werneckii]
MTIQTQQEKEVGEPSAVDSQQTELSLEPNAEHEPWKPDTRVKKALCAQAFCVFIISLDMTILTATLPTVAHALGANATESFWIAASYLLANAVCQPTMAALAEAFGRQAMFLGSVGVFTVGSIVCATAPSVVTMLAGRTVQGIGGGGIISVNLIILSDFVPLRQRSKYQGIIQLVFALGTNIAPIIGGAMVDSDWRWIFYINIPFCAVGLVIVPLFLRYEEEVTPMREKLRSFDWIGSASMVVSSTLFLVGMSWGGNRYNWRSSAVLVPIIAGLAGMLLTFFFERHVAKNPFLRVSVFQHWSGIVVTLCTVIQGYLLFAMTYYLVIYLMACQLYSPILAGTGLLPFAMTVVPVSGVTGSLISRIGRYRWSIWSGWSLSVLGLGLLIRLGPGTHPAAWVVIFMCAGAGQGLLLIGHSVAIQASCKTKYAAYAVSMYSFARSFGLCLGVILGGTIFQNFLRMRLGNDDLPTVIATNFEGYVPILQALSSENSLKIQLREAHAWALRMLFATSTGVGFFGLLLSLTVGDYTLDTAFIPEHSLRK